MNKEINVENSKAERVRPYIFLLLFFTIIAILLGMFFDDSVFQRLSNTAFARNLITFLISVTTIGIALILIYQSDYSNDESYRRSREIFTGLMGVLGTIVGFYFGSAGINGSQQQNLNIADIRIFDKQLMTYVSGGTNPYRYSITSNEEKFKPINDISKDGWIVKKLDIAPTKGKTITVDVLDSRNLKSSREYTVSSADDKGSAAASTSTTALTPSSAPNQTPENR